MVNIDKVMFEGIEALVIPDSKIALVQQWLDLCIRAEKLSPTAYGRWQFMVGTGGDLRYRVELGQRALDLIRKKGRQ